MTLKQTEVGIVPSHWKIVNFSDVCKDSAFGPRFSGDLYMPDGNVATLRTTDLDDWGRISYSTMPLARLDKEKFKKHFLNLGDLIITRSGTCGRTAIFEGFHIPVLPGAFSIRFRLSPQAENRFFRYYFNSIGRPRVLELTTGSVQPNLTSTALLNLKIPLPPLDEQKDIAEVISTFDRKIENLRQQNETLERIAQTLFKQWFVDFEFPFDASTNSAQRFAQGKPFDASTSSAQCFAQGKPSTDGRPYKSSGGAMQPSELGEIPAGWRVGKLRDVIKVNAESISKSYPHQEIEYVDISSVGVGVLESTTSYQLTKAPSRARRLVKHGDVIWSGVRPNRKSYLFIAHPPENLVVSTGFITLTPTVIPSSYLYSWVTTDSFVEYLTFNASGSAYPAVKAEHFEIAEILVPAQTILHQFHSLVEPMREKIHQNAQQIQTLTQTRNALLPKLMSGQLRIGGS